MKTLLRNTSIGVARLVSPIFWYLSLSVSAFNPCQGRFPLKKYMNMWPNACKNIKFNILKIIFLIFNLKIIPSTLLLPQVSIYRHVSGCPSKALVLSEGNNKNIYKIKLIDFLTCMEYVCLCPGQCTPWPDQNQLWTSSCLSSCSSCQKYLLTAANNTLSSNYWPLVQPA